MPKPRIAAILLALALAGSSAANGTTAQFTDTAYHSHALDATLHFLVALPPDYATSGRRYPVVYFLHGLPAGPASYRSVAWVAEAVLRTGREAIMIIPQGSRQLNGDPEYHDWGPGRNWEAALAVELPRVVDARYRTIATRAGRAIVGVSAGGYGAAILDAHHPSEYAVMESWSGYFRPTDPTGKQTLDVGSDADNAYASVPAQIPRLEVAFRHHPTLFAFYVGRADRRFVPDNVQLHARLRAAGVDHVFEVYAGGHDAALWRAHAVGWLRLALDHLAQPSG
jgi:enterochelin esterase-like enzyme